VATGSNGFLPALLYTCLKGGEGEETKIYTRQSARAEHFHMNKHTVDTKKTKVTSHDKYWYPKRILEIEKHETNYNRDDGLKRSRT
jgi:hypothetical protein